jgi:TetR/AcrR family transcriptional repressor of nem operon
MARSMGELPVETDVAALSNFLVTMIQGLRVMSAVCPDQPMLAEVVDMALSVIPE